MPPWYPLCGKLLRTSAASPPESWQLLPGRSRSTSLEPPDLCQCRLECQMHLRQPQNKLVSKDIINMSLHSNPTTQIIETKTQIGAVDSAFKQL